ncbi:peroxide stress protein YaaA [Polaromonas sp.]|uniref:peroxide stress protein YaaA n=1 Tax=Polaromonas sp. TaxID=1869339 RepID=UPI001837E654|nr:peroxide stress protein YaaA [Polaromonas sp.]NML84557.1 peroxide stress protein YaaA [Polaromonas sp.]
MLFLLSPAKALDYDTPPHTATHTQPLFKRQSAELIELLKCKTPQEISSLMKLSDALAGLNVARYGSWSPRFSAKNSKQAVLAFNGDVYEGLNGKTLSEAQLGWAQQHVCILSGLYGVLRPLDWMQPYRLEMGTALATEHGKNLYQFWGSQISAYLNQRAAVDTSPVIVNLASQEYFKAVDRKALIPRVVSCVFEEFRGDSYKVISFMAKRARGLMVRYAVEHQLVTVKKLQGFDAEGYCFDPAASELDRLVFRRRQAA